MECSVATLLLIALLSSLPLVESRYAAPLAIHVCGAAGLLVSYTASTVTGLLVYTLLSRLETLLESRGGRLWAVYQKLRSRVEERLPRAGRAALLALYIAAPVPGSGVWSGALAAHILGLDPASAAAAIIAGNLVATLIVAGGYHLLLTLLGG